MKASHTRGIVSCSSEDAEGDGHSHDQSHSRSNPRDNGCFAFCGQEVVSTNASRCSWNIALVRGIYSSWTGSCNCSGDVGGSGETRTFWPRRSNNCRSLTLMLDILVGLVRWRVRRLRISWTRGHQHEGKLCSWNSALVRDVYSLWTGSCNCLGYVNGSSETRTFWPHRSNDCCSLTSMLYPGWLGEMESEKGVHERRQIALISVFSGRVNGRSVAMYETLHMDSWYSRQPC